MTQKNNSIDPLDKVEIYSLIAEHAWLLDNHESHKLFELYTPDGVLCGIGPERRGRESLIDYGTKRAQMTQRQARHVAGIPRLVKVSNDEVHGTLTIILFRFDGSGMGAADPVAVADAHDIYRRCDDGQWRIQQRRLALAFESEEHRH